MNGTFTAVTLLLEDLDRRLLAHPGYADVRNLRALARAASGRLADATADLEAALRANPAYEAALFNLAWVQLQRGDLEAWRALSQRAEFGELPEAWRSHLQIVARWRGEGLPAAWSELETAGAAGGTPWFEIDRLWLLVQMRSWAQAEAQLLRLASRDADLPPILARLGLLRDSVADTAKLGEWAEIYAGNLQIAMLCRAAAELLQANGAPEESRTLLDWSVALSLDLCSYWVAVGSHRQQSGQEDEALDATRRAVEADPDNVDARVALGDLLAARARPAEAVAQLEVAVARAPRWADVRYQLALLYEELDQVQAAEAQLRAALATRPHYVLARLTLGCLLEKQGRDAEALELLQSVRQSGIRSADLEMRLAVLHARLGHRNQARRARARARVRTRASTEYEDE